MALSFKQRFYLKIMPYSSDDECFIWSGYIDEAGYGVLSGKRAHRIAWELECSEIPEGLIVRHYVCDNRACVNVKHLRLGTHKDNSDNKILKGRHLPDPTKITQSMIQDEIALNQLKIAIEMRKSQRRVRA